MSSIDFPKKEKPVDRKYSFHDDVSQSEKTKEEEEDELVVSTTRNNHIHQIHPSCFLLVGDFHDRWNDGMEWNGMEPKE